MTYGDELPELHGHARDLSHAEIDRVVDLCFQCKLCYPNCPYTPPHDFALDFPRLLLRWKAHRTRRAGRAAADAADARHRDHRQARQPGAGG